MRRAVLAAAVMALAACGGRTTPPSVLLITLDTTRADRLGCYGYRDALTPALDALAAAGVRFDAAYTPSPMTLPAHTTIMTGLAPPEHGVRVNGKQRLPDTVATLAATLGRAGYRTGAFLAAYVLDHRFGLGQGFDVYDDDLGETRPQAVHEQLSVYRAGDRVADAAIAWLDPLLGGDAPFLAWAHFYDPHFPNYENASLAGTRYAGVASYDAEVAFMDQQVGRLVDLVAARGRRNDTVIVVVGDHGEGLGDHGEYEHGYLLSEEVLRVPFVVAWGGHLRAGSVVSDRVGLADVLPTVLDLVGVLPTGHVSGRSLRAALDGGRLAPRALYAETDLPFAVFGWAPQRSLLVDEWKYVRTPTPELYARATDRTERANVAAANPQVVAALDAQLADVERAMRPAEAPAVAIDAEARRRLAALGYVDAGLAVPAPGALRDVKDMLVVKQRSNDVAAGLAAGRIDRPTAITMLRDLVRQSPESAPFQVRLGTLLLESGDHGGAVAELREAARLRPDNPDTQVNLAQALVRSGKLEDALPHFRAALALEPDHAEANLGLGAALAATGATDAARVHLEAAVRAAPGSADARLNLGNVLLRQGHVAEAEASYREALRLQPDHGLAHHNLATVLARGEAVDEALIHAREAVRLAPGLAAAHDLLGRLLTEDDQVGDAIEHYRRAVELDPTMPEFLDDLAAAYAANDQPALAVSTARRAMAKARRAGRRELARDIRRRVVYYQGLAAKESPGRKPGTAAFH